MTSGRLTKRAMLQRDELEEILFAISIAMDLLDEIIIRTHQAMRRTHLVFDVLNPAIERLSAIQQRLTYAHRGLHAYWQSKQEDSWQ